MIALAVVFLVCFVWLAALYVHAFALKEKSIGGYQVGIPMYLSFLTGAALSVWVLLK